MNILDLVKQNLPDVSTDIESDLFIVPARKVDPTVAARNIFLTKIQENIDGLEALTANKPWPTKPPKKEGGRETKNARWFAIDETTKLCEVQFLYNRKPIAGIIGHTSKGESVRYLKGIPQDQLLPTLTGIKAEVEKGTFDEYLRAAREAAGAAMRKKKKDKNEAKAA